MSRRRKHRLKLKSLYVWHRWLGLAAALLVIVLSLTGLALNHTESLALAKQRVQAEWLLDLYGIEAPDDIPAYRAGRHWISQWDRLLYLDDRLLGRFEAGRLRGALATDGLLLVALERSLLLLTPNGELVEQLDVRSLGGEGLLAIGSDEQGRPILETTAGLRVGDAELVEWHAATTTSWQRRTAGDLPAELRSRLVRHWRGQGLSLERVILDLHSGRILGEAGVLLMDAAAILLLFLALSGSGIWLTRLVRNRQRGKRPVKKSATSG